MRFAFEHVADPNAVRGWNPPALCLLATRCDSAEMGTMLLEAGAETDVRCVGTASPHAQAVNFRRHELARYLGEATAD